MNRLLALAALAAAVAAPAFAQAPMPMQMPAACAAVDDSQLSPALASGWRARAPLAAAATAADADKAALPIGKGVDGQLRPAGAVAYPVAPGKPGGPGTFGGLFQIGVEQAGDYQVSLGAGAWIEVARDGKLLETTSHAPGQPCSSLKKTVVFSLLPGRYLLEISGNAQPALPVMVTRVK
jgi:hypothetical protein